MEADFYTDAEGNVIIVYFNYGWNRRKFTCPVEGEYRRMRAALAAIAAHSKQGDEQ